MERVDKGRLRDVSTPGLRTALLPEGHAPNRRDDRIVEILTIGKRLLSLRGAPDFRRSARPFQTDVRQQGLSPRPPPLQTRSVCRTQGGERPPKLGGEDSNPPFTESTAVRIEGADISISKG